jgi:cobalt-zinc-cadmium efflux system protein
VAQHFKVSVLHSTFQIETVDLQDSEPGDVRHA